MSDYYRRYHSEAPKVAAALYSQLGNYRAVAHELNIPEYSAYALLKRAKVQFAAPYKPRLPRRQMLELFLAGYSGNQVAANFGVTRQILHSRCKVSGIPMGQALFAALIDLTAEQKEQYILAVEDGLPHQDALDIAREY